MGRRLAQVAARNQPFGAEGLLAVNQDDILPSPLELPVLKPVVEQQRIASELLNGVTTTLDAVFIHQHHHILEVGGEHVGLVTGHFGIEQQRLAIRYDPRRRGVGAEKEFIQQPLVEGWRLGTVTAGKDGDVAALITQFTGELLHYRRLAGATPREITHGDDLHAEGRVPQNADVVKKAAGLDSHLVAFGAAIEKGTHERRARPGPLFEDHFPKEGYYLFYPRTKLLTHLRSVCLCLGERASRRLRAAPDHVAQISGSAAPKMSNLRRSHALRRASRVAGFGAWPLH